MEAHLHVGASTPFSVGDVDGDNSLGRPALARAYRELGWQDIMLPVWIYVTLTVPLLFVSLQTFDVRGAPRTRVAIVTAIGLLAMSSRCT